MTFRSGRPSDSPDQKMAGREFRGGVSTLCKAAAGIALITTFGTILKLYGGTSIVNGIEISQNEKIVPKATELRRSTFVFLIQDEGYPKQKWIRRSRNWRNFAAITLSWKENFQKNLSEFISPTFRYVFYPKSTWTSGRNRLLLEADRLERDQKWQFEFYIVCDGDAHLAHRAADNPAKVIVNRQDDADAVRIFMGLLLRDRPLRASVGFHPTQDFKELSAQNYGCLRQCQSDPILTAFHRTAVSMLLPYSEVYDKQSWHPAGFLLDLFSAAVVPSYCHMYHQVVVDLSFQHHTKYPRGLTLTVLEHIKRCLSKALYRNFRDNMTTAEVQQAITAGLGWSPRVGIRIPHRQVGDYQCRQSRSDVNYTEMLGTEAARLWRTYCVQEHVG